MQKKVDYLVVGCGLAGIHFCQELRKANKTFMVYDANLPSASLIAGGLYNPIILKRFTSIAQAEVLMQQALPAYNAIETEFNILINEKLPVYRIFSSIEEQNNWFVAADKPILKNYLSTTLQPNTYRYIKANYGFGEVQHTGKIDTKKLLETYRKFLKETGKLLSETFQYNLLITQSTSLNYKNIVAKHIVFAEGFGLKSNPYFKYLPVDGVKGELLTIHAPKLQVKEVLKSSVFLIPLEKNNYLVGATYNWSDTTNKTTEAGKNELLSKLNKILTCNYTVVQHVAGVRPTVRDRRALVGKHPITPNMYVLNGLGTRGVLLAPYAAKQLFYFIENKTQLPKAINCERYQDLYLR